MTKLYSATTGGFYDPEIHGKNMPSDAVDITESEYSGAMLGQADGHAIRANTQGKPELYIPDVSADEINSEIEAFLLRTNWVWEGDHGRSNADVTATKAFRTAMINADRTPRPRDLGLKPWQSRFGRFSG